MKDFNFNCLKVYYVEIKHFFLNYIIKSFLFYFLLNLFSNQRNFLFYNEFSYLIFIVFATLIFF